MKVRWSKTTACAVLSALVTLFASASAEAGLPAIQHQTTITGSRTGYAELTLPQPLHLVGNDEPSFELTGGGPILGAVLRANDALPGSRQHPQYELIRLGPSNSDGGVFAGVSDGGGGDNATLPAGDYRLYLIAADKDGGVMLDFPDVTSGALNLTPSVFTPFSAGPLPTLPWSSTQSTVFGRAGEVVSQGLAFGRAIVRHPATGQRLELCHYQGNEEQQAGDSAYTSGCPGGLPPYSETATSSDDLGVFALTFVTTPGRFGIGGNLTGPLLPIDKPGTLETYGIWMSYDFAPPSLSSSENGGQQDQTPPPPYPASGPQPGGVGTRPGSSTTHPSGDSARGNLSFYVKRLVVDRGRTGFRIFCSPNGPCEGMVSLSPGMGGIHVRLNAGDSRRLSVLLSRSVGRRLARSGRLRSVLRVRSVTGNGVYEQRAVVPLVSRVTVRRRGRRRS